MFVCVCRVVGDGGGGGGEGRDKELSQTKLLLHRLILLQLANKYLAHLRFSPCRRIIYNHLSNSKPCNSWVFHFSGIEYVHVLHVYLLFENHHFMYL